MAAEVGQLRECPGCRTPFDREALRATASSFCLACDYPLFLSPAEDTPPAAARDDDAARRRLPGTEGREALAARTCPACAERNAPDGGPTCWRCGSLLQPPPPPAPAPLPQPAPVVRVVEVTAPCPPRWPWMLATGVLAVVTLLSWVLLAFCWW